MEEFLIGITNYDISPYSGAAGMLLIDFLSKVQPFIPYDITAIALFYFVDFNHY